MRGAAAGEEAASEVAPGIRAFVRDHIADVEKILARVEEVGLTFSGAKSAFGVREIMLLGFRCGPYGKRIDERKALGVTAIRPCSTVKELRRFLEAVSVYRAFIPHFAEVAEPLYSLLRKGAPWDWNSACHEAMDELKNLVSAAPCLRELDYQAAAGPVYLTVDAGPHAAGWVISQGAG
ncbi:MAG: hypothetical protein BJ554DRAFT_6960, partial [Olpidium bornovanus]